MLYLVLGFVAIGVSGLVAFWAGRGARSAPMERRVVDAGRLAEVIRAFASRLGDRHDVLVVQQERHREPFLQLARVDRRDAMPALERLVLNFPLADWSRPYRAAVEEIATRHGASAERFRTASADPGRGDDAGAPAAYLELDFGRDVDGAAQACAAIGRDVYRWTGDARLTCLVVSTADAG